MRKNDNIIIIRTYTKIKYNLRCGRELIELLRNSKKKKKFR